jgi:hypothetical protein
MTRIDDLAAPRFPAEIDDIRRAMGDMAAGLELDADALRKQAIAETGLDDFGPRDYEERLDVFLAALRELPHSPTGRLSFHSQVLQLLKNRLLLTDLLHRHPEILDIEIKAPIIIAGLPRTGTTHLHNLLAADPAFRTMPYWESIEPVRLPSEVGVEPDPRIARTDQAVWFMNAAMPLFALMHEMSTWHVHEEIQLLAIDFSTMFMETLAVVPSWRDYYLAHDQTSAYRYMRTVVQAMQFQRGGERWVLKSPQHLEQLPVLAEVFPDATVVVTHRDPASVVVSLATMIAYTSRMWATTPDPSTIGRYWADRIEVMLRACVGDRAVFGPERSIDVRFDEFMADDIAMVRKIYALAGQPFDDRAERSLQEYMAGHERGRLGRIDYRAADVGLDTAELRERFAFYTERFLTP